MRMPLRLLVTVSAITLVVAVDVPATAAGHAPTTPWPGGRWAPGPAVYGTSLVRDVAVRMSDGVVLRADVSYPADPGTGARAAGRFPVLLTQTPYAFQAVDDAEVRNEYLVSRGYIAVTAHVRGTIHSGGDYSFMSERDARDGVELVNWAAYRLPGSNGRVGLFGCSYLGMTQLFTGAYLGRGSPVKAMNPECAGADNYRGPNFAGGMPTQTVAYWANFGAATGTATAGDYGKALVDDITAGGPRAYAGEFWQQRIVANLAQRLADTEIPILLWSGWGDNQANGAIELYAQLQNAHRGRSPFGPMPRRSASGRYQLVMGPGGHGEGLSQEVSLEWFDTWLKGMRTGIEDTRAPLHVYEMGSGRWLNLAAYPMVPDYTTFYLGAGTLTRTAPGRAGTDAVRYAQTDEPGAALTFQTPPLPGGAILAGPMALTVYASSDRSNLVLIADVDDVDPATGTATRLSSGTLVGSLRATDPARTWRDRDGQIIRPFHTFVRDDYLTPGRVTRLDIAIDPKVASIAPGHALRLRLRTQATPAECAGTTGTVPCVPTAPQAATLANGIYQINHGGRYASLLNLPLLSYQDYRAAAGRFDWRTPAR